MFRATLLLVLAPALLSAQARPRLERPFRGPRAEARREAVRGRIMERLHEIRTKRLVEGLGITPEKARGIADRWEKFDLDTLERGKEGQRLRADMDAILRGPGSEEQRNAKVNPIVSRMAELRSQQQESLRKFEEDVRESLTPAQQARFILLREEFKKDLAGILAERR